MKMVPLRLQPGDDLRQTLEILSLSGTLSPDGAHLHIAVADSKGAYSAGTSALAPWFAQQPSWCSACCRSGSYGASAI